jgi:hypothetical protein
MDTKFFGLVMFTLVFDLLMENLNLGYIFWLVGISALIFHMSAPCDKTFPWVPNNLILWPWCLTYFLKTLTLAISFDWYVLRPWYFTWIFLVTRLFHGYKNFDLVTFYFGIWLSYWKLNFWSVWTNLRYFTWVLLVTRPFHGYQIIWPCDFDFLKTLTLAISYEWYVLRTLICHRSIPCG